MPKEPLEEYKFKDKLELGELKSQLSDVQKISCPSCSKSVPADNLNIQTSIAKCNNCNGIFSFSEQVEHFSNQKNIVQEILQPEGVEISQFRNELDIAVEQPWGNVEIIFISLFPLMVLIITGLIGEANPSSTIIWIALLAFILISTIGYLSYFFIRKKHKIYIHIDEENLYIERRPRKLIKDKLFAKQEIDQVYIKNVTAPSGKKSFGVFMIVDGVEGQKHVELINAVNSRSKAKYIEQEIERHLDIPDRRVPDEDS